MHKYILVPDSYKGTMSSYEVCSAMERGIIKADPTASVVKLPVADGGEGSADAFINAVGGKKRPVDVCGPFFDKTEAYYAELYNGHTAVIEMASCCGLPMVYGRKNPELTTTYGVGELMLKAAEAGAKRIIVCMGGSSTNDAGCGAAAAVGVKFFDKAGREFIPTGGTLCDICSVDESALSDKLEGIEIIAMSDVDNPLFGESGAAYTFAPQKGADADMVKRLDAGLRNAADKLNANDIALTPGAGAAGGMGFGMLRFFHARLRMGIDTVLDTVRFDSHLKDAYAVFTGEGRIDPQSMHGKVVAGVARRAKCEGVPVFAIVGDISDGVEQAYDMGVTAIFSINRIAVEKSIARKRAPLDLEATVSDIVRTMNFRQGDE